MSEATVRELRNHGGEILDRVEAGERVIVTRDGRPVARLEPLGRRPLSAASLVERFRRLPPVDAMVLRADVDALLEQAL
ncbi:MAG: type II toxin-antitoxin system prevent-host-death family antitoxin [Actinomycetota bacterium]|jgi:prevent-host-death family protein|nr:type II toxin-antitoxin system prevent-host-death family antitoxin [Actinomycetota bacterium]